MKDKEINLPDKDDCTIVARIKRTHFYCVREDFLIAWREHETFLTNYEDKLKKALISQARISNFFFYFSLIKKNILYMNV